MHFWNSLPLFRLVIPFILGIVLSNIVFEAWIYRLIPFFLLALVLTHFFIKSYRFRWLYGVLCTCLLFVLGICIFHYSLEKNDELHYATFLNENNVLVLECIEEPVEKKNSFKVLSKVISVDNKPTIGKVLVYVEKNGDTLRYGSRILTSAVPNEISTPSNPNQFDYKHYQNIRGVTHQVYLSSIDFTVLNGQWGNPVIKKINAFRSKLLSRLSNSQLYKNQFSVCSALLLGDKSEMSQELKQTFSEAGVIHVLAVSGLHVGIIFLLINKLLVFMSRTQVLRIIKLLILLLCLWSYAFITSLSPSVMRAVTMFSFIAIANVMQRQKNIYNTLAASAFLLLILEPNMVFEVGFQLSYLAVLGIVSIYPIIYPLFVFKSKWTDTLWQLICVSIAAQIATFPLGIFYFHQFPNYFLVANILVLPLIPFIIYFGLSFLLLFDFYFLSEPILLILSFILDNLFLILSAIQQLPHTISSFLYLHFYEVLLIYLAIGFSILSYHFKKTLYLVYSLVCFLLLQLMHWNDMEIRENRSQIIFYSVNKHSVFGIVESDAGFFMANSDFIKNKSSQQFNLFNHWSYLGLDKPSLIDLDSNFQHQFIWKEDCHIQLGNKKMVLVNENFSLKQYENPIEVDYCLISDYFPIDKLLISYSPKTVIIDSSLPYYKADKLEMESKVLNLNYYNLKTNNALLVDLND